MHEQSETVQTPQGRWINVYGQRTSKAGETLPRKYDFEKEDYGTVQEAERAARKRSQLEGQPERQQRFMQRSYQR